MQEHNRLLYVALTRAEDRLIVCGWAPRKGAPDESWYRLAARGFAALGARAAPFEGGWEGGMLVGRLCADARAGPARLGGCGRGGGASGLGWAAGRLAACAAAGRARVAGRARAEPA